MKQITIQDCVSLRNKFMSFCETAEQHQFMTLLMLQVKLDQTIDAYRKAGTVTDQKEANTMFRVILRVIGEDFGPYVEEATE